MSLMIDDLHCLKTTDSGEDEIYFVVAGRDNAGNVFRDRIPGQDAFSVNDGERENSHLRNVRLWTSPPVSNGYSASLVVMIMEEDSGGVPWDTIAERVAAGIVVGAPTILIAASVLQYMGSLFSGGADDYIGSIGVSLWWHDRALGGYGSADEARGRYEGLQPETGRPQWALFGDGSSYRRYLRVDVHE